MSVLTGCQVESNEDEKATYTVTYNANGGSGKMNPQTAEEGSEITLATNAFTRTGYTFSGWNTAADGKGTPYNDKAKITLTGNLSLYAQWAAETGTAYKVEHFQQNITDDDYTLAKTEPKTGTTGDETAAKAEETAGFTAKEFAQSKIAADGSTVIKIYYDRKMVTLTLNCDNDTEPQTVNGKFGADVKIATPAKTGYTFAAWNPELPATFPAEDAQYTAKWVKEGDYIITYKNVENAANDNPAGYNVETETITLKTATKAGYIFDGWYKESSFATKVTEIAKGSTGNITLYAKWKLETYSITYELNGGTNADENPENYNVETETITLKAATRVGYVFDGWYKEDSFATKVTEITKGSTGNITLYAKWSLETYTIAYILNGDEANPAQNAESNPTEYNIETVAITLAGPTRNLYEFAGWYDNAEFSGDKLTGWNAGEKTGDITLYAKWTVTQASISAAIKAGNTNIVLTGEISAETITAIRSALYENSDARINLDISGTTGLTEIPEEAFYEWVLQADNPCKALAGIVLPEGIESINQEAFVACPNLTEIVIPDSVKTIDALAFANSGLASIKFGSGLESIGMRAFSECNSLTEITVPGNVKTIEQLAFFKCENLEEVVLEEGVQSIEAEAFYECRKLTTVTIPKSVTSIGNRAFYYTSLQTVNYGGTTAEWKAFVADTEKIGTDNDSLLNATIHCTDGIVTAAANAAELITGLESGEHNIAVTGAITNDTISAIKTALKNNGKAKINLDLSQTTGLTSIGNDAFNGCSSLVSVNIPDSVTSIDKSAFYNCSNLISVNIPDSVTSIGTSAFQYCSTLSSVAIPNSVISIGANAFSYCSSLKSLNIPASVTSIGKELFNDCTSLTELTVSEDNSTYKSDGNCIYTRDGKILIAAAAGLTSVTILDGVTSIDESVFTYCISLTSVTIPDGVIFIGEYAFYGCSSLTDVNIPDSVTSIGYAAFNECSSLTSVIIPAGVTFIDKIFSGCSSLTSVTIPAGVTSIGMSAFYNCNNLTTVNYKGSEEQWNKLKADAVAKGGNEALSDATVNCNYTGE